MGEEAKTTLSQVILYFMSVNATPEKVLKRNFILTVRPDVKKSKFNN